MIDNNKVSNIPCRLHNVGEGGVAGADEVIDDLKGKSQQQINAEVDQILGAGGSVDERIAAAVAPKANSDDVYAKTETYNKTELNNMITTPEQGFVTVTATDETTDVTDVLPETGEADTIYRVGNWDGTQYNDSVFSEYAWNGSAYVKLSTKSQVGEVYDISANHAGATYADLSAALGTNGANIPQSLRRGGMSIKFIQTSDNKYVQYRLMNNSFTTDITQWQGVDDVPTAGSDNLVKSGGVAGYINVSQNTETGHTDIKIGDVTTPIPSTAEMEKTNRKTDNVFRNSEAIELPYEIITNKEFDNYAVGTQLTFAETAYRDTRRFDIRELSGILIVNKIPLKNGERCVVVITDANNIVLATESYTGVETSTYYLPIVLAKYKGTAAYCYILTSNATGDFINLFYSDDGIDALGDNLVNKSNNVNLVERGNIPFMQYSYTQHFRLNNPIIGQKVSYMFDSYRAIGIALLRKYIGCLIKVKNINAPISNNNGCVLTDKDGNIVAVFSTTASTPTDLEIDLSAYPTAHYLMWDYGNNFPSSIEIIDRGITAITGIAKKTISWTNNDGYNFPTTLVIGDTFNLSSAESSQYRALGLIDVTNKNGNLDIRGVLPSAGRGNVVITDSNDIVIAIITNSLYRTETIEVNVALDKYSNAAKLWFIAPLSNNYSTFGSPVVDYYYNGLYARMSDVENIMPKHGVLLLHFDSALETPNDHRLTLCQQYGFNVSWCVAKKCFNNSDTYETWTNNDYKNAYIKALKRGDDFGLYPNKIASEYDEAGWDAYFTTALAGLASNGIHNITGFMCGRLDINDDLLNSVKKNGFKVIRGGGAKDAQSVDTYNYTKENTYMPLIPTHSKFFVNASMMMGNTADFATFLEKLKSKIEYAIQTNTAISLFAHDITDDSTDATNITEERLIAVFDYILSKVNNDGLMVMPWRKWYITVNRIDGHEWDYNRLLKMQKLN